MSRDELVRAVAFVVLSVFLGMSLAVVLWWVDGVPQPRSVGRCCSCVCAEDKP